MGSTEMKSRRGPTSSSPPDKTAESRASNPTVEYPEMADH